MMGWRTIEKSIALALAVGIPARGASSAPPEIKPLSEAGTQHAAPENRIAIRRVALLMPVSLHAQDPTTLRLLDEYRAARHKRRRTSDLFNLKPTGDSRAASQGVVSRKAPADNTPHPGEKATPNQLDALGDSLFAEALADRLHTHLKIQVVADAEVRTALAALHLTPTEAAQPEGARRLCKQLDCDAVLAAHSCQVRLEEGATRDLTLRVTLQVPALRASEAGAPYFPRPRGVEEAVETQARPPVTLTVVGSASAGHAFLQMRYAQTPPTLVGKAAQQAATLAFHTLW